MHFRLWRSVPCSAPWKSRSHKVSLRSFFNQKFYSPSFRKQRNEGRPVIDHKADAQEAPEVYQKALYNIFNTSSHQNLKKCFDDVVPNGKRSGFDNNAVPQIGKAIDVEILWAGSLGKKLPCPAFTISYATPKFTLDISRTSWFLHDKNSIFQDTSVAIRYISAATKVQAVWSANGCKDLVKWYREKRLLIAVFFFTIQQARLSAVSYIIAENVAKYFMQFVWDRKHSCAKLIIVFAESLFGTTRSCV